MLDKMAMKRRQQRLEKHLAKRKVARAKMKEEHRKTHIEFLARKRANKMVMKRLSQYRRAIARLVL